MSGHHQPPSKRLKIMEDTQVELPSTKEIEDSLRKHFKKSEWKNIKGINWEDEQVEWTDEDFKKAVQQFIAVHKKTNGNFRDMINQLDGRLDTFVQMQLKNDVISITIQMSVVKELLASKQVGRTPRVSSLLTGMDIELSHDLDVDDFIKQIEKVADWYKEGHETYAFPYFTLIQSSGMGKTRLLKEAKKRLNDVENRACMIIYCHDKANGLTAAESEKEVYDSELEVTETLCRSDFNKLSNILGEQFNHCPKQISDGPKDVTVLLFDEAQLLMKYGVDGEPSLFRRLRWWLRDTSNRQVVAVFTGTSSRLSNFFPVGDPPNLGTSRDDKPTYRFYDDESKNKMEVGKILYPPWFKLRTIGCLRMGFNDTDNTTDTDTGTTTRDPPETEFERSSLYGRPLFAAMHRERQLMAKPKGSKVVNKSLLSITRRILLGSAVKEGTNDFDKAVVCSVVGSRVQMGVLTSFNVASRLVAGAYTCLVEFQQDGDSSRARTCTMPDPICAGLAMGLMDKDWSVESDEGNETVRGVPKKKWILEVEKVFSSGLCLPDKGDPGEIFAALYLLFCGDELRRIKDKSLRTFSISLIDWLKIVANMAEEAAAHPEKERASAVETRSSTEAQDVMKTIKRPECMEINFVQVCRDYLRSESFLEQGYLEHLYNSGTAVFVYPNCAAIDMVGAIKAVAESGKITYHPLLVSVKNWASMSTGQANAAIVSMKQLVKKIRARKEGIEEMEEMEGMEEMEEMKEMEGVEEPSQKTPAVLGILLTLGCHPKAKKHTMEELQSFPCRDTFLCVSVPENDAYGISTAVASLGGTVEESEILSSHSYLAGLESSKGCLRSKSKQNDALELMFDRLSLKHKSG